MKFLLEFVACCGSPPPTEDTRLLVVQEPRRRKHGSRREWRPSLSSIAEDVQRPPDAWHRSLKRKVASVSQRGRPRSSDHHDYRRGRISSVTPTFSPAPFLF